MSRRSNSARSSPSRLRSPRSASERSRTSRSSVLMAEACELVRPRSAPSSSASLSSRKTASSLRVDRRRGLDAGRRRRPASRPTATARCPATRSRREAGHRQRPRPRGQVPRAADPDRARRRVRHWASASVTMDRPVRRAGDLRHSAGRLHARATPTSCRRWPTYSPRPSIACVSTTSCARRATSCRRS